MQVFVTGASGFVGSAVVRELRQAGHAVVGLARSEASAAALRAMGAEAAPGSLEDGQTLTRLAGSSDGVVHLGSSTITRGSPKAARSIGWRSRRSGPGSEARIGR